MALNHHLWRQLGTMLVVGCVSQPCYAEWFILKWIEKPARNGPSTTVEPADRTRFRHVMSFDQHAKSAPTQWQRVRPRLKEGDVIAYSMTTAEARRDIVRGNLNSIGYRLLKYGHLAIVVADRDGSASTEPTRLRLFSSQSFVGPNVRDDIDSLVTHSWDCYRLDQWERVNTDRLHEFIAIARDKAEAWYGYDFSGMFGLWNSNLKPTDAQEVGHDYICSTTVVAALYYAGLELDAIQRGGLIDIVTPKQVVASHGRFIPPPEMDLIVQAAGSRPHNGTNAK